MKEDFVNQQQNSDESLVATLRSSVGNSIEPVWYRSDLVETWIRKTIEETAKGCLEFFEQDTEVTDENGKLLPKAVINLISNPMPLVDRIYPRLKKHGIVFSSEQNPHECDASGTK